MHDKNINYFTDDEADCVLVDPANELPSVVDNSQVSVSEDPSLAITHDVEPIGYPLRLSSVEEASL